jgi:hypothetical protein
VVEAAFPKPTVFFMVGMSLVEYDPVSLGGVISVLAVIAPADEVEDDDG